jgi:hypothetical protein
VAVSYIGSLQTTRMTAVITAIDIGTAGTLEIATTENVSVVHVERPETQLPGIGGSPYSPCRPCHAQSRLLPLGTKRR